MKKFFLVPAVFMICALFTGCNNLQWSNKAPYAMRWNDAVNYCKNLNENGHNDWRLPEINELRTLITNNPNTETGGSCKVGEKKGQLSFNDIKNCVGNDNNGQNKLGDSDWFWSSSNFSAPDNPNYASNHAWSVIFSNGAVYEAHKSLDSLYVRCVR